MREHTILVALTIRAETREDAHLRAHRFLPNVEPYSRVTSWWIAEDDRRDGSDNDSAVFVTPGLQQDAHTYLRHAGMTPAHNKPEFYGRLRWEPEVPENTVLDLLMRVAENFVRGNVHEAEDIERLQEMFL